MFQKSVDKMLISLLSLDHASDFSHSDSTLKF